MTTLTLLLLFLMKRQKAAGQPGNIAEMIYSSKYGKHSFNLDVPERLGAMQKLFDGDEIDEFKALVKGDGGLIVYGPSPAFWPRRHATAGVRRSRLRSGERGPAPNDSVSTPEPPELSRSLVLSSLSVNRGVPSGGLM